LDFRLERAAPGDLLLDRVARADVKQGTVPRRNDSLRIG
jgi:hypothetical protein